MPPWRLARRLANAGERGGGGQSRTVQTKNTMGAYMTEHTPEHSAKNARQRVMVLGNCVAERLQFLLPEYPGFARSFEIVPAPMIHTLTKPEQWHALAEEALSCEIIFTQPLFSFGPCNTAELRKALEQGTRKSAAAGSPASIPRQPEEQVSKEEYAPQHDPMPAAAEPKGKRLILFSSPDFEAYFPDVIWLKDKENLRFKPILDWDSSIIFSCFCAGISIFDVEDIYRNHPLFHPAAMDKKIAAALELYLQRENGLDISTKARVIRNYAQTKLFHSPKHPVDSLLGMMLRDTAVALGLNAEAPLPDIDGFGFNQWPVITRHHSRFSFPEQDYFMLAGKRCGLEDVAMAYYNFYEFHPHVVEANKDKIIPV